MKKIIINVFLLLPISTYSQSQETHRWPIQKINWELGFIDELGKEIYTRKFDILDEEYNSGLVFFKKGNKKGFLDENGKIVFVSKSAWSSYSERLLKLQDDKGFHYLNTEGEIAIDLTNLKLPIGKEVSTISDFHDGLAIVRIQNIGTADPNKNGSDMIIDESINLFPGNWLFGFINMTGTWAVPPTLESATSFKNGISIIKKEGSTYFMDTAGVLSAKLNYKSIGDYSEGFAIVYENDSCFFINKKGTRITDKEFQRAQQFSDGMAAIQLGDKWGFIDTTGTMVIEPKYFVPTSFKEGLAPVSLKIDENTSGSASFFIEGFIDKQGETKIQFEKNVDYGGFLNGLTKGRKFIFTDDNKYTGKYELFYMDKSGKKIWSEIVKQNR